MGGIIPPERSAVIQPNIAALQRRSRIVRAIRRFFDDRGYLSVETPSLCAHPIPESHIDRMTTRYDPPDYRGAAPLRLALLPSPEYWLKRLIAAGSGSVYEIARSFRNVESVGRGHRPEFTMLEYYTVGGDADDSLALTRALLAALGWSGRVQTYRVAELWREHVGGDLAALLRSGAVDDATFQHRFVDRIEPALAALDAIFVRDYPAVVPTLARTRPRTPWAERWELYIGGLEVANCYTEETDPARIAAFIAAEQAALPTARRLPLEPNYLADPPLPPCSGVAMGVDRLVMALTGARDIREVISYSFFDTLSEHSEAP